MAEINKIQPIGDLTQYEIYAWKLKGTIEQDSALITNPGDGNIRYSYNVSNPTGIFPRDNNANSILTFSKHPGDYDSQLGFSSNGNIYYRSFNGSALNNTTTWNRLAFLNLTYNKTTTYSLNDQHNTQHFELYSWDFARSEYVQGNYTDGTAGQVLCIPNEYGALQMFWPYNGVDNIRLRTYYNGTWYGNWSRLITSNNYTEYTVTKTGSGASGTWGISISGNAATATALTSSAGSSTVPIYFSGGKPVQCSTTLGVSITGSSTSCTGNAATATRSTYVDYKSVWVDLSSLNANTYYPVVGTNLPDDGYKMIKVSVQLNSGTKPSWSTHNSGFTVNVLILTTASGWGTTGMETIILDYYYSFANGMPVSYTQNSYSSTPVLWMRGGGKYRVWTDYDCTWSVKTSTYYTYNSGGYTQTVAPQSTLPNILYNGHIKAGTVYGAVWNDYAEMRKIPEAQIENTILKPGMCVKEIGNGEMIKTEKRLERGCKIISDTFGFNIGETDECKTPIAVSGRALVYIYEGRDEATSHIGWPVCSGPDGTVSIMTEEEEEKYPSRIVGTISEIPDYSTWGTGNVSVDGRIWIYVR